MARGRDFDYVPNYDNMVKMAENRGGGYDSFYSEESKLFKPHVGVNVVRILPPAWSDAEHYGFPVFVHTDVGPKNAQYLCLRENARSPHKRCPICDALYDLGSRASQEDKTALKAKISYLYYIIDRDEEKEGVLIWRTSQKNNSEIAIQSIHRRNKSVLNITNPKNGYDVEFTRIGEGRNSTRYRGFMVMRESSPLSDNERRYQRWLDYVKEFPLPDTLHFYKPAYIEEVFYGRARDDEDEAPRRRSNGRDEDEDRRVRRTRDEDDDDDTDTSTRRRARDDDDDDEQPRARSRRARDDDDEDEPPRRSSRRSDDEDEEDRPQRTTRSRARDEDEDEEPQPRRRRSQLSKELDDEVPFDKDKDDDEDEPKPRTRRARTRLNDDDDSDTGERQEASRERARQRLDRSR